MRLLLKTILAVAAASWASFGVSAFAQTPPTTNTITAQPQVAQPSNLPSQAISTPVGITKPHVCNVKDYYPVQAIKEGLEGSVVLGFTITAQGSLSDFKIITSSGSKMLDDAAISCASTWQYQPAVKDGHAIAIRWGAKINWSLSGLNPNPVVIPLSAQTCPQSMLPADGSVVPNGVATTVFFNITADGDVRDAVVSGSSGDDRLDQAALKCVSQWRYRVILRVNPYDILWTVTFKIPLDSDYKVLPADYISGPWEIGPRTACSKPSSVAKPPADTVLVVNLGTDAVVANMRLLQSSGNEQLDDFARSCVSSLRFKAAARNNQPIVVTIPVRIAW